MRPIGLTGSRTLSECKLQEVAERRGQRGRERTAGGESVSIRGRRRGRRQGEGDDDDDEE